MYPITELTYNYCNFILVLPAQAGATFLPQSSESEFLFLVFVPVSNDNMHCLSGSHISYIFIFYSFNSLCSTRDAKELCTPKL